MPRPSKCRRILECPQYLEFLPVDASECESVILNMDEYETIYLVDYEHLTHEECSACMDISRTTVTEIYERARGKLADALVNGKRLLIAGGNYRISNLDEQECYAKFSTPQRTNVHASKIVDEKGKNMKRIAVTYENGNVFQHFGRTSEFKIYDIENNEIVKAEVVSSNGASHGALVGFLQEANVDGLVCGGMGNGAKMAIEQAGIKLYPGVTGSVDEAVAKLLNNTLETKDVVCNHKHDHDHHHEHGGSGCGSHGCH